MYLLLFGFSDLSPEGWIDTLSQGLHHTNQILIELMKRRNSILILIKRLI